MAAAAVGEIVEAIAAEGAAAVMAGVTVVSGRHLVLLSDDVGDLPRLRSPWADGVAIVAVDAPRMVGVTEDGTENVSRWRRTVVRGELMARAALADLFVLRVAGEAVCVGTNTDRDGLARAVRLVAGNAALTWQPLAAGVRGVVELHVEAFLEFRREYLHRRRHRLRFLMADRADGALLARKLVQVAPDARFMTREPNVLAFNVAFVARIAGELLMLGNVM